VSRGSGSQREADPRWTGRRKKDQARPGVAIAGRAQRRARARSEPAEDVSPDSLAQVSRLFANTADGVWVSGPEGDILFWNRAAETILGYPAERVVGQFCSEVFGGCDSRGNRICGWPCPIKALLHGGDLVEHFDMATRTRTGQPVWIDVSCVAVPSGRQRPPTIVHLFRDVTAAHQIEVLVRQQLAQTKLTLTTGEEPLPPGELSQRELQVITLMQTGASTAAIAEQLYISKATVRNHIQNIFGKLKVHTRLEAVAYVNRVARQEPTTRAAGSVPQSEAAAADLPASRHRRGRASHR
jgi:PAS domain S-box-containing protein